MKRKDLLSESDLSDNLENSSTVWYNEDLHCCSKDSDKYIQNLKYISNSSSSAIKRIISMFKSLSIEVIDTEYYGKLALIIYAYQLTAKSDNAAEFAPENKGKFILDGAKTLFDNSENYMDYIDY